jgi:prolyl-tRNA editing enzyme YbaK/EbsC (Cys-tRNA(Pro) deacylase)
MKTEKIKQYLEENKVKFEELVHKTVYTAHDAAQTLKTKLSEIGKPLVIKADGKYMLILLPANRQLDIKKLKNKLGAKKVEIVSEKVMAKTLKLKKEAVGAFGKLRQLKVYVDKNVLKNKKVIFATSDFKRSIKMMAKDFVKLEEAVVGEVSKTKEFKKVKATAKKKVKIAKTKAKNILNKIPVRVQKTRKQASKKTKNPKNKKSTAKKPAKKRTKKK